MIFHLECIFTAHEFFRDTYANGDHGRFHRVIEQRGKADQHRCENGNLQPPAKAAANYEADPNRKIVQQINSIGIPRDSPGHSSENVFTHFPKETYAQANCKADEPSHLDWLLSRKPQKNSATHPE